jgi:TolB-like protein
VLYEMATGRLAFPGNTAAIVHDAILNRSPVAPRALNAKIPPELESVTLKCLEKKPDQRYDSARALEGDLRQLAGGSGSAVSARTGAAPQPSSRRWLAALAVGVLGVVVLALILMRVRESAPAPSGSAGIQSLAVLPLANISGDTSQEFFADGMTEELTTELAHISALRVISRTSAMQYKGVHKPLPQIAKELNVDAVLEGSVQRAGDRVRITAQLIRATSDTHLWAESYDRDLRDVLGLQREVARDIAQQIQVKLTVQEQTQLRASTAVDPQVHDLYLQGLYYANGSGEDQSTIAISYFEQAIAKDPGYAPAYAGLTNCYVNLSGYYRPPREVMPKAKAAALKALELDESLSEAHSALGFVYVFYDWNWAGAEREAKRAIELNPNNAFAFEVLSNYSSSVGRHNEAIAQIERAHALNPRSTSIMVDRIIIPFLARKYDQAIAVGREGIAVAPEDGVLHSFVAWPYVMAGHDTEAIAEAEAGYHLDSNSLNESILAFVYAKTGKRNQAEKILVDVREKLKKHYTCSYEAAAAYVYLGQTDTAFQLLDKAYQDRSECMPAIGVDPRMDPIRSDPRYQELLRRIDLAGYLAR